MQTENVNTIEKAAANPGKLRDYAAFMKFRLASLVVFSAAIAYTAMPGAVDWAKMGWLVLGGFLVTGASNGFNQILEKDLDKLMNRTQNRPLPQERMSINEAFILAALAGIVGIAILWIFMNPLSGVLGLLALLLYTVVYTPLKRVTPFAVFVGAFPGAIPPLLGCVAATGGFGEIPLLGWIMFAGQFMWQFPHFWAIAWVLDDDYRKAGFRMLPSAGGRDKSSAYQVLIYALFLYPISLMPVMFHFTHGLVAPLVISFCSIYFLYQAYVLYKECTVEAARKLMFGSFFYLPAIQLAVLYG
ncbi:MAG: heme o synthase [Bacteroidia bacterium]